MTNTIARVKKGGKNFEVIVDMENALKFKKGEAGFIEAEGDRIFTDSKKGLVASGSDLETGFGTNDVNEIAKKIVREGEVQVTQEHRGAEQEQKFKQAVDFLSKNSVDPQTGNLHTPERISNALKQSGVNLRNAPVESQIKEIVEAVSKIIPIKISVRKIKITVPAIHTGRAYGAVAQFKKSEKWKDNGDLEVIVEVPTGFLMDFYDKLNKSTQGSVITEEIKEDDK